MFILCYTVEGGAIRGILMTTFFLDVKNSASRITILGTVKHRDLVVKQEV